MHVWTGTWKVHVRRSHHPAPFQRAQRGRWGDPIGVPPIPEGGRHPGVPSGNQDRLVSRRQVPFFSVLGFSVLGIHVFCTGHLWLCDAMPVRAGVEDEEADEGHPKDEVDAEHESDLSRLQYFPCRDLPLAGVEPVLSATSMAGPLTA